MSEMRAIEEAVLLKDLLGGLDDPGAGLGPLLGARPAGLFGTDGQSHRRIQLLPGVLPQSFGRLRGSPNRPSAMISRWISLAPP